MEERKSNKKTRIVIIASMLLLLIAIACLCGTTFARYITKKDVPSTQATVAKWGFVVNANANDVFGTDYTRDSQANAEVVTTAGAVGADVKASTDKVVAPGTMGSLTVSIDGSAEVLAQYVISSTIGDLQEVSLKNGATVAYSPIKWKLYTGTTAAAITTPVDINSAGADANAKQVGTLEQAIKAMCTLDADGSTVKAVQIPLTLADGDTAPVPVYYKLEWTWAFSDASNLTGGTIGTNDKFDTYLGYAAANKANSSLTEATVYEINGEKIEVAADGSTVKVTPMKSDNTGYDDARAVTYDTNLVVALNLSVRVEQIQSK